MKKIAILIVAFNRTKSLIRLLDALDKSNYENDKVDLIISIDKSNNKDVENLAKEYNWKYGNKIVKTYEQRLGLRKHIIECGKFLEQYENLIVLEDDIYVSPEFYNVSKKMIDFYEEDNNIAGISLYTHLWNQNGNRPFLPEQDEYDVFFIQYASSWGQIWMRKKWEEFINWYEINNDEFKHQINIPRDVSSWPSSSWLKYHIKYCIENNKYFVYPKISLTTNFSDAGQHVNISNNGYQTPLESSKKDNYKFAKFSNEGIKYDAFFERENLYKYLNIEKEDLCVDLYGTKGNLDNKKYWLTLENKDYKVIKTFGYKLRPHEMNIIWNIEGNEIKLYDTSQIEKNQFTDVNFIKTRYDIRNIDKKDLSKLVIREYIEAIKRIFKR